MFKFANPEYLNALWLIPVLIFLFILFNKNRKRLLEKFADKVLHKSIIYSFSGIKSKIKFGLMDLSNLYNLPEAVHEILFFASPYIIFKPGA